MLQHHTNLHHKRQNYDSPDGQVVFGPNSPGGFSTHQGECYFSSLAIIIYGEKNEKKTGLNPAVDLLSCKQGDLGEKRKLSELGRQTVRHQATRHGSANEW